MVSCTVPLCKSKKGVSDSGISFHEFPSNAALRKKWLENISRGPNPGTNQPWQPADHSTVCSRHFKAENFSVGAKRKILKRGAIPTVFEDYPKYKQPQTTTTRRVLTKHPLRALNKKLPGASAERQDLSPAACVERVASSPGPDPGSCPADINVTSPECTTQFEAVEQVPHVVSSGCQTKLSCTGISRLHTKIQTVERKCRREKAKLKKMESLLRSTSSDLQEAQQKLSDYNITVLEWKVEENDPHALFLKEQLAVLNKTKPRWTEETIQHSFLWHAQSPAAYRFVRDSKLLSLPCPVTLRRYVGTCTETVISPLTEQQHVQEAEQHSLQALDGSLLMDEVLLHQTESFQLQGDVVHGLVNLGGSEEIQ